jgi:hypothetical protein
MKAGHWGCIDLSKCSVFIWNVELNGDYFQSEVCDKSHNFRSYIPPQDLFSSFRIPVDPYRFLEYKILNQIHFSLAFYAPIMMAANGVSPQNVHAYFLTECGVLSGAVLRS